MNLQDKVRQYYLDHFDELPLDKQFHFASRLSAWEDNQTCQAHLKRLEQDFFPKHSDRVLVLQDIIENLPKTKINAQETRQQYFIKYPHLRGYMLALFRVRHGLSIYGIDLRQALIEVVSENDLHKLSAELLDDKDALKVLSTYAVNYIYLVEQILYPGTTEIDLENFYNIGLSNNLSQPDEILLLIYLYTHCIIGETNFYTQPIKQSRKEHCIRMLERLEKVIGDNFMQINLDNKLEFLVCCQIVSHKTHLYEKIFDECEQSVSKEGTFIVDAVNSSPQKNKTSFEASEHRNVLFVMASSAWQHAN